MLSTKKGMRVLYVALAMIVILTSLTFSPALATSSSDFVILDGHVLLKYKGTDAVVVIPDNLGIVEIASNAFLLNKTITSVTIPNGVLAIGKSAFSNCDNLSAVNLPSTLVDIGENAFESCISLKSISIPSSVTNCGFSPFLGTSITTAQFIDGGKTLIYVPADLIGYIIPNTVTKINGRAFFNCTMMLSVSIPQSVTYIGQDAFGYCVKFNAIILPNNITYFGCSPFRGTGINKPILYNGDKLLLYVPSNYTGYPIPASVTTINPGALMQCNVIKDITIPSDVTYIGDYAFYYCTALESITLKNQHVNVGESAFTGSIVPKNIITDDGKTLCYVPASTKKFVFPSTVSKINPGAFADCEFITDIVIPKTVTILGSMAFDGCYLLKTITASSNTKNIGSNPFSGYKTLIIYGEAGSEIQKSAKIYGLTFVEIPAISAVTSSGTLKNYSHTNKNATVTPYGYDYKLSATKNGAKFTIPTLKVFKDSGKYVVTIKTVKKTKTFTFTIDKSKPKIVVKNSKGDILKPATTSAGSATIKVTDLNLSIKVLNYNGKSIKWPNTGKVTKKGSYVVTAKDKAGNMAAFGFKIK